MCELFCFSLRDSSSCFDGQNQDNRFETLHLLINGHSVYLARRQLPITLQDAAYRLFNDPAHRTARQVFCLFLLILL
jgi:hypothetical protein